MVKKSVMMTLGLKKSPVNRKTPYELPDVYEDPQGWHQIAKILFMENMEELMNTGKILLDEAFWRSEDKTVKEVQGALEKDIKPFCGRKAFMGQIYLEKGILFSRSSDQFNEGMENIMLFVITFKDKKFMPQDLEEYINLEITVDGKNKGAWDNDKYIDEKIQKYLDDPEKFYPTLPVYAKAIEPDLFNLMQGAANEIIESTLGEDGKRTYNKDLPKLRIQSDDLTMILIGGTIYGTNAKSMWLDDVCYILPEEEEEE